MRLLVITQAVDKESDTLSFFHEWLLSLAALSESIHVICLYEGTHSLPENVYVHSLGKERGKQNKALYSVRFLRLMYSLRHTHTPVLIHMNEEYVLLGGWFWMLCKKPIYMWRNHYAGTWRTDLATWWCTKIFCTSEHSYTAKFKKTVRMPVGVDLSRFLGASHKDRTPRSILFFARMAPSKRVEIFIEALSILASKGILFSATVVGNPLPQDEHYYNSQVDRVRTLGLASKVTFKPGVPHAQVPEIFATHDIFVNCARSGMFDKTLFEAAVSGCVVIASSDDWRALVGDTFWFDDTPDGLASMLMRNLTSRTDTTELAAIARTQGLATLAEKLIAQMS